jgi:hypothetical protein
MRLEKASYKAIQYACLNFHYAKTVPASSIAYSVFNEKKEWCGIVSFCYPSGVMSGKQFDLRQGEFIELNRMALNGKQKSTSQVLSIAIKLFKKQNPTVKLLISYADKGQEHYGVIYQATNWIYLGENESSGKDYFYNGKWRHDRTLNTYSKEFLSKLETRKRSGKRKYIYPLDKSILNYCKSIAKPYPKKLSEVVELNALSQLDAECVTDTLTSLINNTNIQ